MPVPTYVLGPSKPGVSIAEFVSEQDNGEICSNLTYLGKRGLYTASTGVKIAYLSGLEGTASDDTHFDMSDVELIRNACLSSNTSTDFRGVDILMTSQWPKGIEKAEDDSTTSALISWLSTQIRPRYHFCGLNGSITNSYRFVCLRTSALSCSCPPGTSRWKKPTVNRHFKFACNVHFPPL